MMRLQLPRDRRQFTCNSNVVFTWVRPFTFGHFDSFMQSCIICMLDFFLLVAQLLLNTREDHKNVKLYIELLLTGATTLLRSRL